MSTARIDTGTPEEIRFSVMLTIKRALKSALTFLPEIIFAAILLHYNIKWFFLFWFAYQIYFASARYDSNRCIIRCLHIANECKLMAIMRALDVLPEDAANIFVTEYKEKMDKKAYKFLAEDFRIAGLGDI